MFAVFLVHNVMDGHSRLSDGTQEYEIGHAVMIPKNVYFSDGIRKYHIE